MKGKVHLVIPCYFESGRIGVFLEELCRHTAQEGGISILVVDDGSSAEEQTRMGSLVEGMRHQHPHLRAPLMLARNLGKGGAVHAGWKEHREEEWLGFVDADGASPAREAVRLIRTAREIVDKPRALFASRTHLLGHHIQRHWYRALIGRAHSWIASRLLDIPIHDSQCGLKLVPRIAYAQIAPLLKVDDFGFDIELLSALIDSGWEVEEVPIDWHEVRGGKLKLFRDAWKMFRDILNVRARRQTEEWKRATRNARGHGAGGLEQSI